MKLEDILAIDTSPIDEDVIYDISKEWTCRYSYAPSCLPIKKWVCFLLLYRYIEKFVSAMNMSISLPEVKYCLSKKDKDVNADEYFINWQKGEFARKLFIRIMAECNWQYRTMAYEERTLTRMPETAPCNLDEWESAAKMVRKMNKCINPSRSDAKYHIFWNYNLGWYLQFRKQNARKVKLAFSKGDKKIEELLKEICRPLCIRFDEDFCMLDAGKYLLGLFEGRNSKGDVDFRMMNCLFFIRIVMLDKLLEYAMELFSMEKEDKM